MSPAIKTTIDQLERLLYASLYDARTIEAQQSGDPTLIDEIVLDIELLKALKERLCR